MKLQSSIFTGIAASALCLVAPAHLKGDNISQSPDASKHHHYSNPDGKSVFSDPSNVIPGHYSYNEYYNGKGGVWFSGGPPTSDTRDISAQSSGGIPSQGGVTSGSSSNSWLQSSESPSPVNRATHLIGMTVKNPNNETLGTIRDVVFDLPSGRVAYVVLEKAVRTQGTGTDIAVPLSAFTPSTDMNTLILNADKNQLQNARGFSLNNLPPVGSGIYGAEPEATPRREILIIPVPSSEMNRDQDQTLPDSSSHHSTSPESSPDSDSDQKSQ